jgi:hypothetical protein
MSVDTLAVRGRGVHTVGNLLACATVAHALHARAATYRLLVFERVVSAQIY